MKTPIKFKMIVLAFAALLLFSCGTSQVGSANDTTGNNGATNGTGKVPKSNEVHNFKN